MSSNLFIQITTNQDSLPNYNSNPDSILQRTKTESVPQIKTPKTAHDLTHPVIDSASINKIKNLSKQEVDIAKELISSGTDTISSEVKKDSTPQIIESHNFFGYNILSDSFSYNYKEVFAPQKEVKTIETRSLSIVPHNYQRSQLNWSLLIGLASIILLLFIKAYYQKFLEQIINAFLNFQLADKMFKEKNILLRRAFFILNLNFILIISLFFLLLARTFDLQITHKSYQDYLIILSAVISILFFRYSLFYLTGVLFKQQTVIQEYIHNKYLFNKNIGMALIPIVFTSIYVTPSITKLLLMTSVIIILIITVLKLFRGFQIFLRNGILIFYSILYLCTLELLPLVLGSKIISTLR